ncbi:uncharacterized protein LOC120215604 [Hibiscus syriacus]|uniref:uncharacterized protein LOC120215604 n=1 Tax=Hibiscus syriacus TaxID=106335 RepID=UPI001922B2D8|nr:uncharacterized protein LOC120215604 [Hibiscus syriacus]
MEVPRMKEMQLLWSRTQSTRLALFPSMETKCHNHKRKAWQNDINLYSSSTRLMVKVLRSRVFKLLGRFLIVFALTIMLLNFTINYETVLKPEIISDDDDDVAAADPVNLEFLPILFNDLNNEGVLKTGKKGLLLSDEYDEETIQGSLLSTKIDMEFSVVNDSQEKSCIPDESIDFIFTKSFQSSLEFIDRSLKVGDIVFVQDLGEWFTHSFNNPSDFKIVYYRKF